MNIRKVILSVIGIAILALGFFGMKKLGSAEKKTKPAYEERIAKVFVESFSPSDQQVTVKMNGRLAAPKKITLSAETQGRFTSSKSFRPGTFYKKGDLIIRVDNTQDYAALKALRSGLLNQIVTLLPDIKFEYPGSFDRWQSYVKNFNVSSKTEDLPEPASDQEKFFIIGKNLQTTFYNIKTQEARLAKYRIYAPFSGVLTQANVSPGAMISPGQNLGTFMSQGSFELVLPVREDYIDRLSIGQKMMLSLVESSESYSGTVVRINPIINPSSQTIDVYVKVSGKDLKEGMFLEATLPLAPFESAMKINRNLLVENKFIWGVENSSLVKIPVKPVHYGSETVVVQNVPTKGVYLSRVLPGAREGMSVEIISE